MIIRDEVINVISRTLLVLKDTRRNNLYYYNDSIVIGVVDTVSSSNEDSKITSLWHRRLRLAVGVVSTYRHDPNKGHWQVVKWILRYLLKTVYVGLLFKGDDTCDQYVISFVDSNCTSDLGNSGR